MADSRHDCVSYEVDLTVDSQMDILRKFLTHHLPQTLEILNILKEFVKGLTQAIRIVTDSWPVITSVVLINSQMMLTFSCDNDKAIALLNTIDWVCEVCYGEYYNDSCLTSCVAAAESLSDKIMKFCNLNNKGKLHCDLIMHRYNLLKTITESSKSLPDGYLLDKINPADAKLIGSKWKYGLKGVESQVCHLVTNFPSIAIYDTTKYPPLPVSWMLCSESGKFIHLYTMEEFRGKGFATIVVRELCKIIQANGKMPFCYISPDNIQSQSLFTKLGFIKFDELTLKRLVLIK